MDMPINVDSFLDLARQWQTLIAGSVASVVALTAAYIAIRNNRKSIENSEKVETNRRKRKHAATRAVLPLALAQICDYTEHSVRTLRELIERCADEMLPQGTV